MAIIVPHQIIWSWYTGRWWVDCYIWYSDEGTGRGCSQPAQAPRRCTKCNTHPSTAGVPITVLPLLCGFNVPVKGLTTIFVQFSGGLALQKTGKFLRDPLMYCANFYPSHSPGVLLHTVKLTSFSVQPTSFIISATTLSLMPIYAWQTDRQIDSLGRSLRCIQLSCIISPLSWCCFPLYYACVFAMDHCCLKQTNWLVDWWYGSNASSPRRASFVDKNLRRPYTSKYYSCHTKSRKHVLDSTSRWRHVLRVYSGFQLLGFD